MVGRLSIPQVKAKQGLSLSGPLVDSLTPNYGAVDVCVLDTGPFLLVKTLQNDLPPTLCFSPS